MSEKLYKIVSGVGAGSIALGIITLDVRSPPLIPR